MKKKAKESTREKALKQIKSHRKTFVIYIILRLLVIITLVLQLINKNYENVFLCFLVLALFLVPSLVEMKLKISLPDTFEIVILLFIFAAEILGEIQNFYGIFKNWDIILHTINGFLCAAIGFSIIDILNRSEKFHLNLSPLFVAVVGFCFSTTIGVLWEFCEYSWDKIAKADTQKDELVKEISTVYLNPDGKNEAIKFKNIRKTIIVYDGGEYTIEGGYLDIGLHDTIEDLMVNFIGAIIYSFIGYFYVKMRKDNGIAHEFIIQFKG